MEEGMGSTKPEAEMHSRPRQYFIMNHIKALVLQQDGTRLSDMRACSCRPLEKAAIPVTSTARSWVLVLRGHHLASPRFWETQETAWYQTGRS